MNFPSVSLVPVILHSENKNVSCDRETDVNTDKYVRPVSSFRLPDYALVTIIAFIQITSASSVAYFIDADSELLMW